ncbi:hypothetical protein ACVWW5_004645 [Bradyrhizobium sp. LM3.4]
MLALDAQRLPARRNNERPGTAADNQLGRNRHGINDMFAIIENEQQWPMADCTRDGIRRNLLAPELGAEHAGDDRADELGIRQRGQLDQQPVSHKAGRRRPGGLECQRRLPNAARPDQAHDAIGRQ